ncbi:sensor histidine kinase [Clostridium ganghwense]|uniref:histidine kinase n=1 Tax=Clostridium ganghwense TaxID=312089 RepID=A0ABT4CKR0_9CLOT|nr:HAMP domain-containing sensor histidine kinase [Clostridium ganghwense]MCY6369630.1 HAMP domain-containing sensor histidine kinase [Clostridium ganghwense]
MNKIIIMILGVLCLGLVVNQFMYKRQIKKIISVIEEIQFGNMNQRVRIRTGNKLIKLLCEKTNSILDKFQDTFHKNQDMLESRKKMVSNISHDLRTPLTSLLGYIEAIQNTDHLNEEEREEYLNIVHSKAQSLSILLEEFFQLSKIEADDINLEISEIDICETLREGILNYYNDFTDKRLKVNINIPESKIYVLGHKGSIVRIVDNIISNAMKYGIDGGEVGVDIREEEKYIWVDIWDNGKGIAKENLPYIFDRLYKEDTARSSKIKGNGLGLTIVKKLAEMQNGSIKVESIPYEKTTFSFSIPKYKNVTTQHS